MKISVIGTGYVGLVSGACLADLGHEVVCVDIDPRKVEMITTRTPPIYEKGLQEILDRNVPTRCLPRQIFAGGAGVGPIAIGVGTPFDGQLIDLNTLGPQLARYRARTEGQTELAHGGGKEHRRARTTTDVVLPILEAESRKVAGRDFGVGMNPEFLRGRSHRDFMSPDRIVLGGIDQRSIDSLAELYGVFKNTDFVRTDPAYGGNDQVHCQFVISNSDLFLERDRQSLRSAEGGCH
jgi:UDPglucose 6-dehydrogenase/GDP-mannose 6-dehydrogenase